MGCLFLDGEHFDLESELDDHPRGECQAVPEVIGVGAPKWQTGIQWFKTLDAEVQKEKLGEEIYTKWKKEQFDLSTLVTKRESEVWGPSPKFGLGN
jgi:hypothetical protein